MKFREEAKVGDASLGVIYLLGLLKAIGLQEVTRVWLKVEKRRRWEA